jgi:hypothetical protein
MKSYVAVSYVFKIYKVFEMFLTRKPIQVVVVRRYDETVPAFETNFSSFPCELVIINHAESTEEASVSFAAKSTNPSAHLFFPVTNVTLYQFLLFDERNFLFCVFS